MSATTTMTYTSTTSTTTTPQPVSRNPKDSMASTWRSDPSKWTQAHKALSRMDFTYDPDPNAFPKFSKNSPVRPISSWSTNLFVIYHALIPVGLQALFYHFVGRNMHPVGTFFLYLLSFVLTSIHEVSIFRRIAKQTGFFDGDEHARDNIPDVGVDKVLSSVHATLIVRSLFIVFIGYRTSVAPHLSMWLPVELFLYSVVLDFWFYLYHRSCHEIGSLWRYHRRHHLTKHPIALLSAYADTEQEILEIAIIPLLTYTCLKLIGLPMGFHDWWMCHQFLIFAEAMGHSGLRVMGSVPGVSAPILKLFGCDLVIEDHDLHHRKGWRTSCNYGKQTRLWDRVFSTCGDRIESVSANVDHNNPIHFPLI